MNIKAVVFDYGGVISLSPPPENETEIGCLCGLPVEKLRELNRKYRNEWDRGNFRGTGYFRHILSVCGIFPDDETLEKITLADMEGWKRFNSGTVSLMRSIKASGLKLGILSNMPHDFLAWLRQGLPVFGELDAAVFSCDYNIIKPEEGIYEKMKERLACEYTEIVFFDDLPDNIEKAREIGIHGFVWESPGAAMEILKGFNIGITT